jgi:hypothetical protein
VRRNFSDVARGLGRPDDVWDNDDGQVPHRHGVQVLVRHNANEELKKLPEERRVGGRKNTKGLSKFPQLELLVRGLAALEEDRKGGRRDERRRHFAEKELQNPREVVKGPRSGLKLERVKLAGSGQRPDLIQLLLLAANPKQLPRKQSSQRNRERAD